jgi:hypothetical protein
MSPVFHASKPARTTFASLLLHEGRSVIEVARQLGHGGDVLLRTYGHVIEELEDRPQLPAEDAIGEAREAVFGAPCTRLVHAGAAAASSVAPEKAA